MGVVSVAVHEGRFEQCVRKVGNVATDRGRIHFGQMNLSPLTKRRTTYLLLCVSVEVHLTELCAQALDCRLDVIHLTLGELSRDKRGHTLALWWWWRLIGCLALWVLGNLCLTFSHLVSRCNVRNTRRNDSEGGCVVVKKWKTKQLCFSALCWQHRAQALLNTDQGCVSSCAQERGRKETDKNRQILRSL